MSLVGKFNKGDKVLCYHASLLYEAKVLEVNNVDADKPPSVLLHYNGWKDRWDEWVAVDDERILEYNDENLEKAKKLKVELEQSSKKKKSKKSTPASVKTDGEGSRASTPSLDSKQPKSSRASTTSDFDGPVPKSKRNETPKTSKGGQKKDKSIPSDVESPDEYANRPAVNLDIPDTLRKILVDDWDLVTRQYKLVHVPAEHTVHSIVHDYVASIDPKLGDNRVHELTETGNGIISHFNKMLGTQMLYKFERPQYADKVANCELLPSQLYGVSHLLRLFVRLPTMLTFAHLSTKSLNTVLDNCGHFLAYLKDNSNTLLSLERDYETAPPEYQKRAWS